VAKHITIKLATSKACLELQNNKNEKIDYDKSSKKFDKDNDSNTSSENDDEIDEIKPADNDK
ncbi:7719_t:CDS:2, partial [Gigaspora margarita]